jgi:hypothetical protein
MAQQETEHLTRILTSAALSRAEAQFRSLLKASGFELTSITPTSTMIGIVEGKPV